MNDTDALAPSPIVGDEHTAWQPWSVARTYAAVVVIPAGLVIAAVVLGGARLSTTPGTVAARARSVTATAPLNVGVLLLQVIVILGVAHLGGLVMARLRQPRVLGEILGGIVLGPTVLASIAPDVSAALFPKGSLVFVDALAQLGLLLFMFLLGFELDLAQLRGRASIALIASHAGISMPFLLGVLLSLAIFARFAPVGVPFAPFALFIGVAMSVTAFPVLARILQDRGVVNTPLGTTAMACAAIGDVTAWCILAVASSVARATGGASLMLSLGGTLLYVLGMLGLGRCLRIWLARRPADDGHGFATGMLLLALGSAYVTERLGIHGIFGAFFTGALVPRGAASVRTLAHQLRALTGVLLLPLYFAVSGLRTSLALVSGRLAILVCLGIIVIAIAGKLGGTAIAGRISGLCWRDAVALGVLMNTRGLMELVVLNIGLDIGVLTPLLFAMLVTMALTTTAMTVPLLDTLEGRHQIRTVAA